MSDSALPTYAEIVSQNIFQNPRTRFNSFFDCEHLIKYKIIEYVQFGFRFLPPDHIQCYLCGLHIPILKANNPKSLHKKYNIICPFNTEDESLDNHSIYPYLYSIIGFIMLISLCVCLSFMVCLFA